jgi:hypothetical protein
MSEKADCLQRNRKTVFKAIYLFEALIIVLILYFRDSHSSFYICTVFGILGTLIVSVCYVGVKWANNCFVKNIELGENSYDVTYFHPWRVKEQTFYWLEVFTSMICTKGICTALVLRCAKSGRKLLVVNERDIQKILDNKVAIEQVTGPIVMKNRIWNGYEHPFYQFFSACFVVVSISVSLFLAFPYVVQFIRAVP